MKSADSRGCDRRSRRPSTPTALALLFGFAASAGAANPQGSGGSLDAKAFFKPELYISTAHVPLEEALAELPNRTAWEGFLGRGGEDPRTLRTRAHIDPRSGAATSLIGAFPLIPGDGVGNQLTLADVSNQLGNRVRAVDAAAVGKLVRRFIDAHEAVLGIDTRQLGEARVVQVNPDLWQISIPQVYQGIQVRDGRLAATLSHGNLVLIGTEAWGNVATDAAPLVNAEQALHAGFVYAEGRSLNDDILREPTLEIVPFAPSELQRGEAYAGPTGKGYSHRLVWTFVFQRVPQDAQWEVMVDARSGELLAFQDKNSYVERQIKGGVYPLTSTGICPNPDQCGTMQTGWPMPFADTGFASPNNFTNSAGIYNYASGTVTTTLTGRYVDIVDNCGSITQSSATGHIDLGGTNGQHDCTTGGGSAGNTASSRSAFYEVNKLTEQARGWLPSNTWLQNQLTTNVNINQTCNAFWNGSSINFYRSGGGCRNTGELAGVFDHEWGHGLDDNDTAGALSNSSEAYADIAAIYRLETSCVGHGFFDTSSSGSCGLTVDGTGRNANEAQTGAAHCDTDCSGVRDADWAKHNPNTPDTALGFVCGSCLTSTGPCGRQVHCAAAPVRQAAWDLVARDLAGAPFNLDSQTAFLVGNRLFYQGSGNIGLWHACTCGSTSSGCGATNGYLQWLAADDDDGNVNNGTPHMTAIFNAYNRHGIACATPTPTNSGCAGGPSAATSLTATPGNFQVGLSWTTVAGATRYWVFRSEGHAGCNFGKAKIAEVTGTTFSDTQVANGRTYFYNVVPAGASSACSGPAGACVSAIPTAPSIVGSGATLVNEGCNPGNGAIDPAETVTVNFTLANVGSADTTNVVGTLQATGGVTAPSGPQNYGALTAGGPAATRPFTFTAAGTCGGTLTATLQLQDGPTDHGTVAFDFTLGTEVGGGPSTFSNTASITIPAAGAATPYPSSINVSGLSGSVTKVKAALTSLSHTFSDDIDIVLVSPGGQTVMLMSDSGGGGLLSNLTLSFDDAAASTLPDGPGITSGTYRPTNWEAAADPFPSPAPAGPYGATLSLFNGTNPNGTWSLYVADDFSGDSGSIAGGWSLTIEAGTPVCCAGPVAGITVSPTSGLVTTETGGTASFTVVLNSTPAANVTIGLSSSDTTEGTVSPASLTFTPANALTPQTVTVTGINDTVADGNVGYTVVTAPASSGDPAYNGLDGGDVGLVNNDDDANDLIFADGFESGGLSAWSSSGTDGGDLSVTAAAALGGSFGLAAFLDDPNPLYVRDETPAAEPRYRARFSVDPNGFDPGGSAHETQVFAAYPSARKGLVLAIFLKREGSEYRIWAQVRLDSGGQAATPALTLTDAPHSVELDWRRATAPGANNGGFELWIDGASVATLGGLDNDLRTVEYVLLGALQPRPAASGTLYLDRFDSRRQNYIGP